MPWEYFHLRYLQPIYIHLSPIIKMKFLLLPKDLYVCYVVALFLLLTYGQLIMEIPYYYCWRIILITVASLIMSGIYV
jgi:hypothetical protein